MTLFKLIFTIYFLIYRKHKKNSELFVWCILISILDFLYFLFMYSFLEKFLKNFTANIQHITFKVIEKPYIENNIFSGGTNLESNNQNQQENIDENVQPIIQENFDNNNNNDDYDNNDSNYINFQNQRQNSENLTIISNNIHKISFSYNIFRLITDYADKKNKKFKFLKGFCIMFIFYLINF